MKFMSNADGFITALRYYKNTGFTGTTTGNLWTVAGANLASLAFTNETGSGWQTVTLSTPVPIVANTIYVVSYFSSDGHYNATLNYFTSDVVNGSAYSTRYSQWGFHLLRYLSFSNYRRDGTY